MELKRFYVRKEDINGNKIKISGEEHTHLAKVLRFKKGYSLLVADNSGQDYYCTVDEITANYTLCTVNEVKINETEHKTKLILLFGVIKPEKFEIAIQKAVEIGATQIIPFYSENTDARNVRMERIERIALEACKQCGRAIIPEISEPKSFDEALTYAKGLKIIAYEKEQANSLKSVLAGISDYSDVSLVVGSEGGFTPYEVEKAKSQGFISVSLGKRILRAETAVIAGLANISMFLED